MTITVADLKAHLNLTTDADDALLGDKIAAAEAWVAAFIGNDLDDEAVPAPILEAIRQLAAWWYEQRESALVGTAASEVPFGVVELLNPYREWTF